MNTLELILDKKKFFFHELGGLYLDELEIFIQTNFARSKFDSNKQIVILRPFNIIGPNMPNHLALGSFINQINSSINRFSS